MDPSFWHDRWSAGQIGFHQAAPHEDLVRFGEAWLGSEPRRVLVPLCGKSVDVWWLADRGHTVVGVELVSKAVEDLFAERGVHPDEGRVGLFRAFTHRSVTILVGDVLDLAHAALPRFDRIWDRAALVALPAALRAVYAPVVRGQLLPGGSILQNVFHYDDRVVTGPPFSVPPHEVSSLYADLTHEVLDERDEPPNPSMRDRLDRFVVRTLRLTSPGT